jgi:hypothetical protein
MATATAAHHWTGSHAFVTLEMGKLIGESVQEADLSSQILRYPCRSSTTTGISRFAAR